MGSHVDRSAHAGGYKLACVLSAVWALNGSACEKKDCSDVDCVNAVTIELAPMGGVWTQGAYTLTLTLDEQQVACDFEIPRGLPSPSSSGLALSCGQGREPVTATFWQRTTCDSSSAGAGSTSAPCMPIADQYYVQVDVDQAPKSIATSLTRDDQVVLNDLARPVYHDISPNGPDCGPTCHQASQRLSFDE